MVINILIREMRNDVMYIDFLRKIENRYNH